MATTTTAKKTSQARRELAAGFIGHWVGRMTKGKATTELHLVESAVNDQIEAKCGKRITAAPLKEGSGMAIEQYLSDTTPRCAVCLGKAAPDQTPGHDDETPFPLPGATTGLVAPPE